MHYHPCPYTCLCLCRSLYWQAEAAAATGRACLWVGLATLQQTQDTAGGVHDRQVFDRCCLAACGRYQAAMAHVKQGCGLQAGNL